MNPALERAVKGMAHRIEREQKPAIEALSKSLRFEATHAVVAHPAAEGRGQNRLTENRLCLLHEPGDGPSRVMENDPGKGYMDVAGKRKYRWEDAGLQPPDDTGAPPPTGVD